MNITPSKFRKKPVEIEAMRWDGTAESQIAIFTWSEAAVSGWFDGAYFLSIRTLEGEMRADIGDWIIRGVQGEFYPCKPDIFEATYEAVTTTDPFTEAARAEALRAWVKESDRMDSIGTLGAHMAEWARDRLTTQEPTEDEVAALIDSLAEQAGVFIMPLTASMALQDSRRAARRDEEKRDG